MKSDKVIKIFQRNGSIVTLKTQTPNIELTTKDIITSIDSDAANLKQQEDGIKTSEKQIIISQDNIEIYKENIKDINENLKKLKHHEEWALSVQESKLKNIVNEIKEQVEKKVRDGYNQDEALTEEGNLKQKFHQFRQYIATNPRVAEEIAPKVYKDRLYKKDYLVNPFIKG